MRGSKQDRERWANLEKDQGVFNAGEIRRDGSVHRRRAKLEGVARSGSVRRLAQRQNFRHDNYIDCHDRDISLQDGLQEVKTGVVDEGKRMARKRERSFQ
jgi:hypothetical protein